MAMQKKVLIVEDSLLMHKIYQMALKAYAKYDIEAHFAADGQEEIGRAHV